MNFNCTNCEKRFHSERGRNSHMLFMHSKLYPECKNWKAIDEENIKIQRITQKSKDIIKYLERCLKNVDYDRLEYAPMWISIKKEIEELFTICKYMKKSNIEAPKMNKKVKRVLKLYGDGF